MKSADIKLELIFCGHDHNNKAAEPLEIYTHRLAYTPDQGHLHYESQA